MKQLLTGKCLEDFDKWLQDTHYNNRHDTWIHWSSTTLSMQWGVIQDFGDSKSINITLYQLDYQDWYGYEIVEFGKPISMGGVWRRDKAREEAIKHFNKIYNEKH